MKQLFCFFMICLFYVATPLQILGQNKVTLTEYAKALTYQLQLIRIQSQADELMTKHQEAIIPIAGKRLLILGKLQEKILTAMTDSVGVTGDSIKYYREQDISAQNTQAVIEYQFQKEFQKLKNTFDITWNKAKSELKVLSPGDFIIKGPEKGQVLRFVYFKERNKN